MNTVSCSDDGTTFWRIEPLSEFESTVELDQSFSLNNKDRTLFFVLGWFVMEVIFWTETGYVDVQQTEPRRVKTFLALMSCQPDS